MDDEEAFLFADDGVHHEVEDDGGDRSALGDSPRRLEGKSKAACSLSNQNSAHPNVFDYLTPQSSRI